MKTTTTAATLILIALCFLLMSCSGSTKLSGSYEGSFNKGSVWSERRGGTIEILEAYKLTFMEDQVVEVVFPADTAKPVQATYKVEGKVVQVNSASGPVIFQIEDDKTLTTLWRGEKIQLKKHP